VAELRTFQDLSAEELARFHGVVLLAGHSSVKACEEQPRRAFANNVASFADLVQKLQGQKFLIASSVLLYVHTHGQLATECAPLPEAVSYYDLHKQMIEQYARIAYANHYALRFGTVCGPSPHIRLDLLLNSLIWSALNRGYVEVANRAVHRPILGINDLCRAITTVLTKSIAPGAYNLASANITIGDVADYVARRFQVPCREIERPNRYDMQVSTEKITQAAGMRFRDTVESLTEELAVFFAEKSKAKSG
jgi:nucleoside-diphosphate-sugar epimerase